MSNDITNEIKVQTPIEKSDCFVRFKKDISTIELPEKFTYPFYYTPHPIAVLASEQVQNYIESQTDWQHDFGMNKDSNEQAMGKMFGVLIVQNHNKEVGFLAAFSGKLAESNILPYFVPPIFDRLDEKSFFLLAEAEISEVNKTIRNLEADEMYVAFKRQLTEKQSQFAKELKAHKTETKAAKKERDKKRKEILANDNVNKGAELELLSKQSIHQSYQLKKLKAHWNIEIEKAESLVNKHEAKIAALKVERKERSYSLQAKLFSQYTFLNFEGKDKSLWDIFKFSPLKKPPSGAGVCAAPKLLQYAFNNNLKPIALAEFWWGKSPSSEIRKHQQYYPSCRGKCEPILSHMLIGLEVEENPLIYKVEQANDIETVFEDKHLVVINKPVNLLSTPGKHITDSVLTRMQAKYPEATGSLVVHRLDMATSGLMLIAKNEKVFKGLQIQFIQRTIKKRYIAQLDGKLTEKKGIVDLPLTLDFFDRPRQMVCYENGKEALTFWKTIDEREGKTVVHFYPQTGRTHQLRMHAAHSKGLNTPITGDILYGKDADRMYLHAEQIKFEHPITKKHLTVQANADFYDSEKL